MVYWTLIIFAYNLLVERLAANAMRRTISSAGPCAFPLPFTEKFELFCQTAYHETPYVCDPGGILSRTEVEFLHKTASSINMTSCFCDGGCGSGAIRIAILLVPVASTAEIKYCDASFVSGTLSTSAIVYAQLVATQWRRSCDADVMFVYVQSWRGDRLGGPLLVPLFGRRLQQLRRYSVPFAVSEPILNTFQSALLQANRLIVVDSTAVRAAIPSWALALSLALIAIVGCAIYIANSITKKMGQRNDKQKSGILSVKKSSDKFRAGFGGGMIINSSQQQKKSVMMFRTFSKPQAKPTNSSRL